VGAAALVAAQMHRMLPPLLSALSDWTVKGRLRATNVLLGLLWLVGPAATTHAEALLAALLKTVEDEDEDVRRQVRCGVALAGAGLDAAVYLPLVLKQLAVAEAEGGDAAVTRRGLGLSLLDALLCGASADALQPHLPSLLAAVAHPAFCVPPSQAEEESSHAYAATQLRLCGLLETLVRRAGPLCARPPQVHSAYCALMRLAAVPSSAARGFAAQQRAMSTLAELAAAAGVAPGALHAQHMPELVGSLVAGRRFEAWDVHASEWHLLQALLRQSGGAAAGACLLEFVLPLTFLLDPKQDPTLRLTALGAVDHLLTDEAFCAAPPLTEWAEHVLAAMLLPNLVWRAGRVAEQVRLAAMLCVSRLLPQCLVSPAQLHASVEGALPVLLSCLDDDNVETRGLSCEVLSHVVRQLGSARLTETNTRALYPELLKRLDDASDSVRLKVCGPLVAFLHALKYSTTYAESGANFDRTNFQYLLRGLLVHLDDASVEVQQAVLHVLEEAVAVDAAVLSDEVRAVRERHRSTKLCDALLQRAQQAGAGQLV